ncbi:2'-5' RNA ligase family protein [Longispora urticae]
MDGQPRSALVAPVRAADRILAAVAVDYPRAVRTGLPAHVTLLYPFVPVVDLEDEGRPWLRDFAAAHPPVELEFTEVRHTADFVYLPAAPLGPLCRAARERWPGMPPYAGRFGTDPEPHVTVGLRHPAAAEIAAIVAELLPVREVVDQLWIGVRDQGWTITDKVDLTGP